MVRALLNCGLGVDLEATTKVRPTSWNECIEGSVYG